MGKKLVIKGADFSANCIVTEILAIDCTSDIEVASSVASIDAAPFADSRYSALQGKEVVGVELKPSQVGTLSIVGLVSGTITTKATITITNEMVDVKTYFPLSFNVGDNEIVGIAKTTDTGSFYYNGAQSDGFIVRLGTASQSTIDKGLAVNWYISNLN